VADDHAGNGCDVIGAHKDTARSERRHVIRGHEREQGGTVCGKTEESDTIRMVGVAPCVGKADLGAGAGEERRVASLVVQAMELLSACANTEPDAGSYVSDNRRSRKISESTGGISEG
jgi:hypothetical protein